MGDISRLSGETSAELVDLARRVFGLELVEHDENEWVAKIPTHYVGVFAPSEGYDSIVIYAEWGYFVHVFAFNSETDDLETWGDWAEYNEGALEYVGGEVPTTLDALEVCLYRLGFHA